MRLPPVLRGALAALATLALAALLPPDLRLGLLAGLLALTAGIYLGFGLLDGRPREQAAETVVALAFLAVAVLGAWGSPFLLALGWIAHVGWDLLHHDHGVRTRIAGWVPPFCLAYDLALAAAILAWWPPF